MLRRFRAAPRLLAPSPVRVRPQHERARRLVDVPVELALAAAEVDEHAAVQRALLRQRRVVERAPTPRAQRQARRVARGGQAERRARALVRVRVRLGLGLGLGIGLGLGSGLGSGLG